MNDDSVARFRLSAPIPQPRPLPRVVSRWHRRAQHRAADRWLREFVWRRDAGISRASGATLLRGATDYRQRAEFAHLRARSVDPKDKWNPDNVILVSTLEHALSDPRTAHLGAAGWIEIEPVDPDRPFIARARLRFTHYGTHGDVLLVHES